MALPMYVAVLYDVICSLACNAPEDSLHELIQIGEDEEVVRQ